ncbi:hypothetical protein CKO15_06895 [Halorhodospira abdelmalekii]|uniref:helix-hairpin-helix domain-containing protein n=1 Tax=Halorhodospira abdelmalekii TaxID=421629 RepID=UPI0019046DF3|nr:hypothetical protein [Halorhodospira abdelmalekii]MBK1735015.1 hypothetical protein [Halorhodospira abdelmalekii]
MNAMDDHSTTVVPFCGGALERAAAERLYDYAQNETARRALGGQRERYRQRLGEEFAALARWRLEPGVLLELAWVVRDLRNRGVVFGLGYGAQCGSLLLHLLGLHGVDPLEHDLPFVGFGQELRARRLHLRVSSRAEQAELAAGLRRFGRIPASGEIDQRALYIVVGREPAAAASAEMVRLRAQLDDRGGRATEIDPCAYVGGEADQTTLRALAAGATEGLFLVDEPQLREALKAAQPETLAAVAQLIAVCRDGAPRGLATHYLERRQQRSRAATEAPHPLLTEILESTHGLWLFTEQVVAAVARLTEGTWGDAVLACDGLREERYSREEGEWSQAVAAAIARVQALPSSRGLYLVRLLRQALAQTVERGAILPEVLEAYRQAYFKTRYPAIFYAARSNLLLTQLAPQGGVRYGDERPQARACAQRQALIGLCRRLRQQGVTLLPPDVNRSEWGFSVIDRRTVLFGLGAIAAIDRTLARRIVRARRNGGGYRSLMDLIARAYGGEVDRRWIEPLIFAGALDGVARSRSALLAELEQIAAVRPRSGWRATSGSAHAASGPPKVRLDVGPFALDPHWDAAADVARLPGGEAPDAVARPGWIFQRELDVLGCVPSCDYFPDAAAEGPVRLRAVT